MNSLSVGKKDYAQIPVTHFGDWSPAANAAVLLDLLLGRMLDDSLNPVDSNNSAAGRTRIASKYWVVFTAAFWMNGCHGSV